MNLIQELEKLGIKAWMLDDSVYDAVSTIAHGANNGGIESQVRVLRCVCGWSDEEILTMAKLAKEDL